MSSVSEPKHDSCEFQQTLDAIESFLCAYYGIQGLAKARDFLLKHPRDSSEHSIVDQCAKRESPRAAVWLRESQPVGDADGDLFLGIYFRQDLIDKICDRSPLVELNVKNLDSFCVLVEELSHFHLICQRAEEDRTVSQLEIEWQGEIDKFLLSAVLFASQKRSPELQDLQTMLFESVVFYFDDSRYVEANIKAAKFWKQAIASGIGSRISLMNLNFRRLMMLNYHRPLQEKRVFSGLRKVFV